jgi:NADH-quinone oxidoreductase subunit K
MITIPISVQLLLAAILFTIGLAGVLVRRNIIFILMCIEIMLNSAGMVFIIAGAKWQQADGQVVFIFILSVAAAEVSVALALVIQMYHHFKTLQTEELNKLKEE